MTAGHSDDTAKPGTAARPPVSVIVPAYNEEGSLGPQVEGLRGVLARSVPEYEILVVDDGSTDRTADVAAAAGVRVLRHVENRGYGASLKTGIRAARFDTVAIIDADGTYPADQLPVMLDQLETADMVVASRTGESVSVPLIRRPPKWVLGKVATLVAGKPIPDLNSGMRVFRRDWAIQYFPILPDSFSFTTTITLGALADEYHVVYHAINYFPRVGKSKIVPWHFVDFLVLIIRISMMFNPLRVFLPLSLLFGGLGVLKLIFDVAALFMRSPGGGWQLLLQPALSTSAVLLLFVGLQFLMIGMVADGVVRRIAQHNRPLAPSRSVFVRPESADAVRS
jgi:glycosyltransferase involved in cell wall biosynthesis